MAVTYSKIALGFARHYMECILFPADAATRAWGHPVRHPEEFLDLYALSDNAVRRRVFPLLDPEHYTLFDPDAVLANPLADFFEAGLHRMQSPHPLISLEYMRFLRSDLLGREMSPQDFFNLFSENLVDPGPHFDVSHYRKASGLAPGAPAFFDFLTRGADLGLSPNPYFDFTFYRALYPEAPRDNLAALCDFVAHGDAELRAPSERFDSAWYRSEYSTEAHIIAEPLTHFLRWGRFARNTPRPVSGKAGQSVKRSALPRANFTYRPDSQQVRDGYAKLRNRLASVDRILRRDTPPAPDPDAQAAALSPDDLRIGFAPQATDIDVFLIEPRCPQDAMASLSSLAQHSDDLSMSVSVVVLEDAQDQYAPFLGMTGVTLFTKQRDWADHEVFPKLWRTGSARDVLFMHAGATLETGALAALRQTLDQSEDCVAATPLIRSQTGRIYAAGGQIRRNGLPWAIDRNSQADSPGNDRSRKVAWGPTQCLLIRRDGQSDLRLDAYADADCRDAALGLALRANGGTIAYAPEACAICPPPPVRTSRRHMLSDRQTLLASHADQIETETKIRILAHCEPLYFPTPETDLRVEKGFTDWNLVDRAAPEFVGHYQPHMPADLGHYDTRLPKVTTDQKTMAQRYGVDGFVFDYFNFTGEPYRFEPVEQFMAQDRGDFGLALCWRNGDYPAASSASPLLRQSYDPAAIDQILERVIYVARTPGAIRIDGRPLFVVADPLGLADINAFAETARAKFAESGFPGVYLAGMQPDPGAMREGEDQNLACFDAFIEPAPHRTGVAPMRLINQLANRKTGKISDYAEAVASGQTEAPPSSVVFPSVCPGWDDSPKRDSGQYTLQGALPHLFQAHTDHQIDRIDSRLTGDERLLFVNGWNRWSSGAHLEPDTAFGHSWLQALDQSTRMRRAPRVKRYMPDMALVIHAFYTDILEEILDRLTQSGADYPLFITTVPDLKDEVEDLLSKLNRTAQIRIFENRGRDVLPFYLLAPELQSLGFRYVLKLHTKKSPHRVDGDVWREALYRDLTDRQIIERLAARFSDDPSLGMVGPESQLLPITDHLENNARHLKRLATELSFDFDQALKTLQFVAGTMFFARLSILTPLLKLRFKNTDFEPEDGQTDGTFAHALERGLSIAAATNGRRITSIETLLDGATDQVTRKHRIHQ